MIDDLFGYFLQCRSVVCLFDGIDGIAFCLQRAHCLQGILEIAPFDSFFSAKRGLM